MKHIVILKAKSGEFDALRNLDSSTADRVIPLFDIGRITEDTYARKYMQKSGVPISTYLDRVMDGIYSSWPSRPAMIDMYQWKPDATVEGGSHVLAYVVDRLCKLGMPIIPVIGYDRWQDPIYQQSLVGIFQGKDYSSCIRLDNAAIEDLAEPDLLLETLHEMVDALELSPGKCYALIDFDDVSMTQSSVEVLINKSKDMLALLKSFAFKGIIIAGCSIPRTIDLAVQKHDSASIIIRKEMLVWQTLRMENPERLILTGDYGVRGPSTVEAPSKYTNGKIRYAVKGGVFIARGHPFCNDGDHSQMHGLATFVAASSYFLSGQFSWGDDQILTRMVSLKPGSPSDWIAIDTNHHLSFVVSEIEEFEQSLLVTIAKKGKS